MRVDPRLRIAVVEDVPLFRQLIVETIEADDDMEVCAYAASCEEARTLVPPSRPDILLLDLNLPDGLGFEVGLEARQAIPDLRVIILSEYVRPRVLSSLPASERPYWSYLLKSRIASRAELLSAIRGSLRRSVVDSGIREQPMTQSEVRMSLLTDRQREILGMVAMGMSNGAIADTLYMSPKSVEYHLTQIYHQLGVANDASGNPRVQAAVLFNAHDGTEYGC